MRVMLFVFASFFVAVLAHAQQENSPQATTNSNRALNPDLSLDGLFSASQFNRSNPVTIQGGHDPKQTGFNIQQVELTLGAAVDPYFRGDANIVLTSDGIELEEAYVTSLSLPYNLQLKAGQFLAAFGRFNPTHPHAWDFANQPLINGRFFGGDGFRNPGAQLSWLSPLPWYSEVIASAQNSNGSNPVSFRSSSIAGSTGNSTQRSAADLVYLLRWNNFFPLGDTLSLNLGASALTGPNVQQAQTISAATPQTRVVGGDVYLKYRRPETLSFIAFQFEALQRWYDTGALGLRTVTDRGLYAHTIYRFDAPFERWQVGVRYDLVGTRNAPVVTSTPGDDGRRWRMTPVVTFYPSEFSKVRLQYEYDRPFGADFTRPQQVVHLELEYLIGAHGAHKF